MTDTAPGTCGTCGAPLTASPTGRPARYCSGNCRKAAHRERQRLAEQARLAGEARQHEIRLADEAAARAAQLWHPLEDAVADARESIDTLITDAGRNATPDQLAVTVAAWREAAARLTALAGQYTDAVARAARRPAA